LHADDADSADGGTPMFSGEAEAEIALMRMLRGPRSARIALEGNLDPDLAQERHRSPQAARQRPRAIGPRLRFGDALARRIG
jgi:hypothetical protein